MSNAPTPGAVSLQLRRCAMYTEILERLLDEHSCHRLVVDYARWLDAGERDNFAALFADDAVWEMPGYFRCDGPAGITDRLVKPDRVGRSRHLVSNVAIEIVDTREATGFAQFVNYRDDAAIAPTHPLPAGEPRYIGRYLDRFVRTPEGWRFAHRLVELDFASRLP